MILVNTVKNDLTTCFGVITFSNACDSKKCNLRTIANVKMIFM